MFDLTGRKALVTGATGGLGQAIARALHAQGATVALSGTRPEALEALAAELGERASPVLPPTCPTRTRSRALVPAAEAAIGPLDILVNNAGITRDNLFMRMKDEEWEQVLAVNLTAAFRLSRAAVKGMMRRRCGRIVNIGSVVGTTGNPGQGNYAAAKAGLVGHDQGAGRGGRLARDHRQLRRPGLHQLADDRRAEREAARGHPGPRARRAPRRGRRGGGGLPSTSPRGGGYVTGHTLHVNGGMAMY